MVILDIAVPRDFDPRIHDGEQTCLFNIDDLKRIREQTLHDRLKHVGPAEAPHRARSGAVDPFPGLGTHPQTWVGWVELLRNPSRAAPTGR